MKSKILLISIVSLVVSCGTGLISDGKDGGDKLETPGETSANKQSNESDGTGNPASEGSNSQNGPELENGQELAACPEGTAVASDTGKEKKGKGKKGKKGKNGANLTDLEDAELALTDEEDEFGEQAYFEDEGSEDESFELALGKKQDDCMEEMEEMEEDNGKNKKKDKKKKAKK